MNQNTNPSKTRWILAGVMVLLVVAPSVQAGLVITEDQDYVAWPGTETPIIETTTSLANFTNGVSASTPVSQTFTVLETFTLDKIYLAYNTGATSGTIQVRIQEANVINTGTAYTYAEGTDLFDTDTLTFSFTIDTDSSKVMTLDFTGVDEITLEAGKVYAFEAVGIVNGGAFSLMRRSADTYSGGAAFSNRVSVNGLTTRDFGVAFVATPEPTTMALLLVGGLATLARRRRK